jgi:hypothetical protein
MEIQNAKFGPGASKIFTSNARYIVAIAGQRGGKTTTGSYWSYTQATRMRVEETTNGVKHVPPYGIICSPTYDLLRHSTLNRFFEEFPSLRRYYKEYQREINIPIAKVDGKPIYSKVFTRSLEEWRNLRGLKAWWAWMDEGDIAPEESFEMIKSRISDHEDGKLLITSTLDMNSWINRLIYQPMLSGRMESAEIISWPSIERPGFPRAEWERLKKEMDPIQFARDYEGKFSFETGLVYGDVLKYGIIPEVPRGVTMLATFYGIDYGLNDPTVVLVMGYGSDFNWYVLNETVMPMMSVDQINDVINSNLTIFNSQYGAPWATYYDPAGGVATLSITPDAFPLPAIKDIPGRITLVRNFIYQKRLFILEHCVSTIRESGLYSFQPGRPIPMDSNNHTLDALGYIIHNAWALVDGLKPKAPEPEKNRLILDLEAKGLMIDGEFQMPNLNNDYFIV